MGAAKRKALSKKTRFEVMKRDKFTCQYCGATSPNVLLVVDHIKPVATGGDNDLLNLATACQPCNAGKGARELGDDSAVEKQRSQLKELQERREQLDLMLAWKRGLVEHEDSVLDEVCATWAKVAPGTAVNDGGRRELGACIRRFSASEVLDAIRIAAEQYLEEADDSRVTPESADRAFSYIKRILLTRQREKSQPYLRDLYQLRAGARTRFEFQGYDHALATRMLTRAFHLGANADELWTRSGEALTWSQWRSFISDCIEELEADNG